MQSTGERPAYGTFTPIDNDNRGNFSTGICDLFPSGAGNRTDCCAIAFCGVLVHDRNRHAVSYESSPPPWWRRLLIHVGIPFGLFTLAARCQTKIFLLEWTAKCAAAFPDDGSGPYLGVFNASSLAYNTTTTIWMNELSDDEKVEIENLEFIRLGLFVVIFCWVNFLLLRAARHRLKFRRHLLQMTTSGKPTTSVDNRRHTCATATCGWYSFQQQERRSMLAKRSDSAAADLCSCLFQLLSSAFCSLLCNCWCQCCGMCAAAQEEREIMAFQEQEEATQQLSLATMDFVTFQPFEEYSTSMEDLRTNENQSWRSHFAAQSTLSKYLWRILGISILLSPLNLTVNHFLVVLATFSQAFFILFLVYWWKHRMDVSLDTVTKCFATGFLVSTQLALVAETAISTLISWIAQLIFVVEMKTTGAKYILLVLIQAGQAFIVAAGSEELSKYFGFWMVDSPDWKGKRRSLRSHAAGITVAMVATATGFACCENLEYVFSSADAKTEIVTLLTRSLFPVHQLAAAIQSIGVCRRDIEGDPWKLGRIILPALLLHGFFDFVLMVAPVVVEIIESAGSKSATAEDNGVLRNATMYNHYLTSCNGTIDTDVWAPVEDTTATDQEEDPLQNVVSITTMVLSFVSVIVGACYYVAQSKRQRRRLETMEEARHENEPLIT